MTDLFPAAGQTGEGLRLTQPHGSVGGRGWCLQAELLACPGPRLLSLLHWVLLALWVFMAENWVGVTCGWSGWSKSVVCSVWHALISVSSGAREPFEVWLAPPASASPTSDKHRGSISGSCLHPSVCHTASGRAGALGLYGAWHTGGHLVPESMGRDLHSNDPYPAFGSNFAFPVHLSHPGPFHTHPHPPLSTLLPGSSNFP